MTGVLLALGLALAGEPSAASRTDVAGAADHPLIHRYEGSWILGYRQLAFDAFTLPLSAPTRAGGAITLPKQQVVEGRHTRLLYVAPDGRSSLEVFRNYAGALEQAGFQVLFSCDEDACGSAGALPKRFLYTEALELDDRGQATSMAFSQPAAQHFLAARLPRPEGDVFVSVYVAREDFTAFKDLTMARALALVDVIETAPMEAGKVEVDADALARDLGVAGRAVVYGVRFDTNSATLLPASAPTLREIARMLDHDPSLKLYVVGHTDDVGEMSVNLDLSRRRAEAVVSALVGDYKIQASRLEAAGVGPLAPVAPNTSEQGRAMNRRVELVPR